MPTNVLSVLVISRFELVPVQVAALKKQFGEGVFPIPKVIDNAAAAVREFQNGGYIDWIFIGKFATHEAILHECERMRCKKPLRPRMREAVGREIPDVFMPYHSYVFLGWERISRIELVLQDPGPLNGPSIFWMASHAPLPDMWTALQGIFTRGLASENSRSRIWIDWFSDRPNGRLSAGWIKKQFGSSGADELVFVGPLTLYEELAGLGIHPLWPEMQRDAPAAPAQFVRWWRIDGLKIYTE